ncbi:MAG: cob(I)yrinic acid a,c-diamide adenosyltransferase [Gracilimonas sp.]|uniref:cob(I)yrinic acid a,c-diamide adenosyltransferase n=1 Tax=Gracilimonas TaxID=649462 RepID=UPI001B196480|nr:cob(I)yrinic acid a,c-diamide adenosyltransferase [Gracilimonas sp.]MBO6587270.1 cob(I)yrinic acid a,c-diamide adenosyltransferase [Gracilimonas sp.]MBO6614242.1 cob(I)yrinic acid a,c-diamide adenosyltransferase [Gracilimonas sp.]
MKIYTKKGDSGNTSLFGGQRVSKSSKRIDAYGTVDELNSILGMAAAYGLSEKGAELIVTVQQQLFVLGADLATPQSKEVRIERIGQSEVEFLEKAIDEMEETLEPLKNFILPGGAEAGSTLHFARTVCRRAERITVECRHEEEISEVAIMYINRLSDFLFVLARFENKEAGTEEKTWIPAR